MSINPDPARTASYNSTRDQNEASTFQSESVSEQENGTTDGEVTETITADRQGGHR